MHDKIDRERLLNNWQLLPFVLLVVSLFYVRFLVSVSVGLMGAVVIYNAWVNRGSNFLKASLSNKFLLLISLLFVIVLLDGSRVGFTQPWLNEVVLKLPLILVPWYMFSISYSNTNGERLMALLTSMVVITSVLSVGNYFLHADQIDAMLLESKHVPIIGGSHHIYFGIFMALSFWLSAYFSLKGKYFWFWRVCAGIILINLHILASRTGLVALYGSVPFVLAWMWFSHESRRWVLIISLGCVLFPMLAYFSSTSLQNKIANSVEDFNTIKEKGDMNYKSLAMRIEAWEMTFQLFHDHPIFGVGGVDFETNLQHQYQKSKTTLILENRIGPHNQFLETAAKYGLFALLVLISILLITIPFWKTNPLLLLFTICFLISFLLESVLERQLGMICFGVFLTYAIVYSRSSIEQFN